MSEEFLKFSFFLPTYNEEPRIKRAIETIASQDYPKDKIEVLLVDGGSTDKTIDIVREYSFVKVLNNPKKLADFGAKIAAENASGEFFVIFAADNGLVSSDWLKTVNQIFLSDKDISTFWCKMIASSDDSSLNRYYELVQNDPLSFFINNNLESYIKEAELKKLNSRSCYFFKVDPLKPLIWGANGLIYRTKLIKDIIGREGFLGDNDVFQELIEAGKNKVVYSRDLSVYHHHVASISQWISKWQRNYIGHFLNQSQTRNLGWVINKTFKYKLILWVIYSFIPLFSLIHCLGLSLRDRNIHWLYHPIVSFAQACTYFWITISRSQGRKMISNLLLGKK